jgi:SAM-dependent methyltransferase
MIATRLQMCAGRINARYKDYMLLDAGCRTMDLKPLLKNCLQYFGTDLVSQTSHEVLQCDLEKPLPFEDNSFDIVTALDVLEHLNNPHEALKELFRISRKAVFISLPNLYYIQFRLNFLRGYLSEKYVFPALLPPR